MTEIEAILNSRPLTPLSANPNDLMALTPGHFLIGEPLTSTVDPQAQPNNTNLLQRWKTVSHLKKEFWQRWTKEYLCELQNRHKWKSECHNAKKGTMVILKEDHTPVLTWPIGRIVETIKGKDGLVRVADVKTASGILRRPIHKLAPLPIAVEEDNNSGEEQTQQPSSLTSNSDNMDQLDQKETQTPPAKRRRQNVSTSDSLFLLLEDNGGEFSNTYSTT